jgi:hypothetical protein
MLASYSDRRSRTDTAFTREIAVHASPEVRLEEAS